MTLTRTTAAGAAALLLFAGLTAAATRGSAPVMVGALESPLFGCEDGDTIAVRPLFVRTGGGWKALADRASFQRALTGPMSWTVAFDGRSIGDIRTVAPMAAPESDDEWSALRHTILSLAPGQLPPHRVTPGLEFSGWCSAPKRPLVVVTPANVTDPDRWTRFTPAPTVREAVLPAFRGAVGAVLACYESEKLREVSYTADDLEVARAYRNQRGQTIVNLRFAERLHACAGDGPDEVVWSTQWFLLGETPAFLGSDLQLVDAGDYDADGRSELLFAYSGYNRDGYTLFADDFRARAEFRWGYH